MSENALWEKEHWSKEKLTDHFKLITVVSTEQNENDSNPTDISSKPASADQNLENVCGRQKKGRQLRSPGDEVEERNLTSTEVLKFLKYELFQVNKKTIIGFGFRMICKIIQIS